jgi:ABC-type multidrug transport system permease subunit
MVNHNTFTYKHKSSKQEWLFYLIFQGPFDFFFVFSKFLPNILLNLILYVLYPYQLLVYCGVSIDIDLIL